MPGRPIDRCRSNAQKKPGVGERYGTIKHAATTATTQQREKATTGGASAVGEGSLSPPHYLGVSLRSSLVSWLLSLTISSSSGEVVCVITRRYPQCTLRAGQTQRSHGVLPLQPVQGWLIVHKCSFGHQQASVPRQIRLGLAKSTHAVATGSAGNQPLQCDTVSQGSSHCLQCHCHFL